MQEDAFEKADSTDWLNTPLHSLSHIDSALRCQICKEFYSTPMITSCSHTFCSLCIRRCLSNDGRCPACRAQEQEIRLRNNGAMEELVEAFKLARTDVLEYARKSSIVSFPSSPTKRSFAESRLNEEVTSPSKRTRYSERIQKITENIVISDSATDGGYKFPGACLVRCPICNFQLLDSQVNAHLDRNCYEELPDNTDLKKRLSHQIGFRLTSNNKPVKRPERLPLLNFSMLKDAQLRKKLAENGLSQSGSRLVMQRRFTEWITLWNANCDARLPRPVRELRSDLEKWERIQDGKVPGATSSSCQGVRIKEKNFNGKAWADSHYDTFKELIEKAQQKCEKPQIKSSGLELETAVKPEVEFEENTTTLPNSSQCSTELPESIEVGNNNSKKISPRKQKKFFEKPPDILSGNSGVVSEECWAILAHSDYSKSTIT